MKTASEPVAKPEGLAGDVDIIIPARWASRRFPGKPLVPIAGAGGSRLSLLGRTIEAARAMGDARVIVATDDRRVVGEAEARGVPVQMTSASCRNGTERCAEAVASMARAAPIVVNLQGDAPLTPPWVVAALVDRMRREPGIAVATPVVEASREQRDRLFADQRRGVAGATTAVRDRQDRALYFSKAVLPAGAEQSGAGILVHLGVYVYRAEALSAYAGWPEGPLERAEGLEQLRFLEQGLDVTCVEVDLGGRDVWEVNLPEDVGIVEAILRREGMA